MHFLLIGVAFPLDRVIADDHFKSADQIDPITPSNRMAYGKTQRAGD
jgi:hypothetical protein